MRPRSDGHTKDGGEPSIKACGVAIRRPLFRFLVCRRPKRSRIVPVSDSSGLHPIRLNLALVLLTQGDFKESEELFDSALGFTESRNTDLRLRALLLTLPRFARWIFSALRSEFQRASEWTSLRSTKKSLRSFEPTGCKKIGWQPVTSRLWWRLYVEI